MQPTNVVRCIPMPYFRCGVNGCNKVLLTTDPCLVHQQLIDIGMPGYVQSSLEERIVYHTNSSPEPQAETAATKAAPQPEATATKAALASEEVKGAAAPVEAPKTQYYCGVNGCKNITYNADYCCSGKCSINLVHKGGKRASGEARAIDAQPSAATTLAQGTNSVAIGAIPGNGMTNSVALGGISDARITEAGLKEMAAAVLLNRREKKKRADLAKIKAVLERIDAAPDDATFITLTQGELSGVPCGVLVEAKFTIHEKGDGTVKIAW